MVTKVDSGVIAHDGGTIKDALDKAKPIADYVALRAYTGNATQVRITSNGLSGFFYYDATDTVSADNGGTIIVSSNGKRWKRLFDGAVHVKWFGAKGDWDGTAGTDDTQSIQNALNFVILNRHKFKLTFSGQAHKVSGSLNLNLQDTPSAYSASLIIENGSVYKDAPGYLFTASSGYNNQGTIIQDISFACAVGVAADVFDCDRLIDVIVNRCTFKRFRRVAYSGAIYRPGFSYYYAQSIKMTDCYIWGTNSYTNPVIDFGATYDCKFTRVFISFGPGMAFRNAAHALSIKDCTLQGITTAAIEFPTGGTNLQNVSIEDNYFEENNKNIVFSGTVVARALTISGNVFTGSSAGKSIYLIEWDKLYFTSSNVLSESNSSTTKGFAVHGPLTYGSSFTTPIRSVNDYQDTDTGSGGVALIDSLGIVYTNGNTARSSGMWAYRASHDQGLAFQGTARESTASRSFVELNGKSVSGAAMQFRAGVFGNADIYVLAGTGYPLLVNNKVAFGAANDLYPVASSETKLGTASNRWLEVRGENIYAGVSGVRWTAGAGSPEGVVYGLVGSLYSRTDGGTGTSLYVKETGTGNTGWVAK